jgi:hypothetical protein
VKLFSGSAFSGLPVLKASQLSEEPAVSARVERAVRI